MWPFLEQCLEESMTRPSVHRIRRIALFTFGMLLCTSQLEGGQEQKGLLTVKRIYSQPSLGGRLNRGVKWAPDGKAVSFFETKGEGVAAKSELWALDVASGQRRLLANAEKLETVLPAENAPQSQGTTRLGLSGGIGLEDGLLVVARFVQDSIPGNGRVEGLEVSAGGFCFV